MSVRNFNRKLYWLDAMSGILRLESGLGAFFDGFMRKLWREHSSRQFIIDLSPFNVDMVRQFWYLQNVQHSTPSAKSFTKNRFLPFRWDSQNEIEVFIMPTSNGET